MDNLTKTTFWGDKEERLINCIQQNPVLFDVSNASYKNNILRQTVWNNIAQELGIPSKTIQSKWKNIRYRYVKRLKCIKKSPSKNTNAKRKHVSYDLSFIDKFLVEYEDTPESLNRSDIELENSHIDCSGQDYSDDGLNVEEEQLTEDDSKNDPLDTGATVVSQKIIESVTHQKDDKPDSEELYCLSLAEPLRSMERKERERVKFEIAKIFKDAMYIK